MARKVQTVFNGQVVDTRTTNRVYTHAVVRHSFDEVAFRAARERSWSSAQTANYQRINFDHLKEKASPDYRYASIYSDAQRAEFQAEIDGGLEAYIARDRVAHEANTERLVVELKTPVTVAYAGRLDLAQKALQAALKNPITWAKHSIATVHDVVKAEKSKA